MSTVDDGETNQNDDLIILLNSKTTSEGNGRGAVYNVGSDLSVRGGSR